MRKLSEEKKIIETELMMNSSIETIAKKLNTNKKYVERLIKRFDLSKLLDNDKIAYRHFALFSGGNDSLVSTYEVMENGKGECVIHIDTGIGIEETRKYVKNVCDKYNWPLQIIESPTDYEEFIKRYGFPKPGNHNYVYRYLKEHALSEFASRCTNMPYFYTGVRKTESERRKMNVSEEYGNKWFWKTPIADYDKEDLEKYKENHNLPTNPVTEIMDMSGECLCGAYFDRISTLEKLAEHYPCVYQRLKELEELAHNEHGNTPYSYWGSEGLVSENEKMPCLENIDSSDMVLCSDCERN